MRTKKLKAELKTREDEEVVQKSSCSLRVVLLILAVIFLILLFAILRMKNSARENNTKSADEISLIANTDQEKIDSTALGEEIDIKITAEQLDSAIKSITDFPLKKTSVTIDSSKVLISGKTSNSIFGLSVDVSVLPKIVNEDINYEILEIKASGVTAPKAISDQINQNLANSMSGILPSDSRINITDIKLFDGYLELIGQRK